MIQNTIQKITKIKTKISTTGGTSDARFIRKISPCIEFGLVSAEKKVECTKLTSLCLTTV